MNQQDHVRLIAPAISLGGVWADLGSGRGAFTLALREVLGSDGTIYSVDRDTSSLKEQEGLMYSGFPGTDNRFLTADFSQPLDLPPLDGLIMANSLHFVETNQQVTVLGRLLSHIKPGGAAVIVEYNAEQGNRWVPFPVSLGRLEMIAAKLQLSPPVFLEKISSGFLNEIYSAALHIDSDGE